MSEKARKHVDEAYYAAKGFETDLPELSNLIYGVKQRLEDGIEDGSSRNKIYYVRQELLKKLDELTGYLDSAHAELEALEMAKRRATSPG